MLFCADDNCDMYVRVLQDELQLPDEPQVIFVLDRQYIVARVIPFVE